MANDILKKMQEEILSEGQKNDDTFYQVSDQLTDGGYRYDAKGVYCPLKFNNSNLDYYLKIDRQYQSYGFTIGSYGDCFSPETQTFNSRKSICAADDKRNNFLFESFQKISSNDSKIEKMDFYDVISDIGIELNKEDNYDQITKEFGVFKNKKETDDITDYELYLLEIETAINWRKNPTLNEDQQKNAEIIKEKIISEGFVNYLNDVLDKIQKGSHKNIYRKVLGAFNVMRGRGSYLFETTSHSGEGKSLEDEIAFEKMIPSEYIFKKNNMTEASFLRYSEANPNYFTRLIILFGDFGSKRSFQKIEDVFDIIKILITEKSYSKDLAEKNNSGGFENKTLDLIVESIGGVYSTTLNSFTDGDPQLESRTLKSTTFENKTNDIIDFLGYLNCSISIQNFNRKDAEGELLLFQSYLLSLVSFDKEIINPFISVFKRYVSGSGVPFRDLKQLFDLFDAYCVLTYFDCDEKDGFLVASEKQLTEFLTDVCLDNVLIPYESNFIDMLKAEGKDTELSIIDEEISDNENKKLDSLNEYFNTVLEDVFEKEIKDRTFEIKKTSFSDLEDYYLKMAIKKLLKYFKLGGTSVEHKDNVFFRKTDIKRIYGRYKAYKDIDDVSKLLHNLYLKGFLNKLEFKDPTSHENIYYLTSKCQNIKFSIELKKEDRKEIEDFFNKIGFYDTN